MSLRREVLNRIMALLQRKTLIETKNRTLKCIKRHHSTVRSTKNVAVLTEDGGICPPFSSPLRGIWQLKSPQPGNLLSKAKKMLMHGGQPGAGGGGLGAAGIDWCINGKRTSIRYVRTGKTGLAFWNFRLSREFSSGMNQKNVYHVFTSLEEFPGICGKW